MRSPYKAQKKEENKTHQARQGDLFLEKGVWYTKKTDRTKGGGGLVRFNWRQRITPTSDKRVERSKARAGTTPEKKGSLHQAPLPG